MAYALQPFGKNFYREESSGQHHLRKSEKIYQQGYGSIAFGNTAENKSNPHQQEKHQDRHYQYINKSDGTVLQREIEKEISEKYQHHNIYQLEKQAAHADTQ